MGRKGLGGQKGSKSIKVKPNKNVFKVKFTGKAKERKSHSKAVKSELKRMSNDKKIKQLNADHNKMVSASSKPKPSTSTAHKKKPAEDAPDVGGMTASLANF